MTTDANIARQVIQDELEFQINTAKTELEVLANRAEGTMVFPADALRVYRKAEQIYASMAARDAEAIPLGRGTNEPSESVGHSRVFRTRAAMYASTWSSASTGGGRNAAS